MTDAELQEYLRDNGYPEHIVREGHAGLLRRWREFVTGVERGYSRGLEDYRNDLDIRGIIELAGLEDDEVRLLDDRLKKLLMATHIRIWESAPATSPSGAFWDFGYPSNAGPDLLADLRTEELLH